MRNKKLFPGKLFLLPAFILLMHSQVMGQTFWTEDFGTGCNQGNLASAYTGTNGAWTITNTGTNDANSNKWFVSATEAGMGVSACGDGCANNASLTNRTLHVGNDAVAILGMPADLGASYNAGGGCGFGVCVLTDVRVESPTINTTGNSNITLSFLYMENGDGTTDDATLWYFDGTSWAQINALAKTTLCGSGQGTWTSFSTVLPASANNNANVKIGFRWVNNDDATGTDPSFAVDDITLSVASAPPVPGFSVSDSTICSGTCINFTDTSQNNPTSWIWTFNGGTPATSNVQNPTGICYNTPGTYDVKLVVANSAGTDSITKTGHIVVSSCAPVVAGFTSSNDTICEFSCLAFTDTSLNSPSSWNWTFTGGAPATSTAANPSNVCFGPAGTYQVQLVVSNGTSSDTAVKNIVVEACAQPVADFSSSDSTLCMNDCISFTDLSTNSPSSWQWSFPGGTPSTSTSQNPTGICYNSPGTYNVTLIAFNASGSDTMVKTLFIDVENCTVPTVNFTVSDTDFCANTCVNFTDLSVGNPTSWSWEFPGATNATSTSQHPTGICYDVPGTYDVILTATNQYGSDSDTLFGYITVNACAVPEAGFIVDTILVCAGTCIDFTDTTRNGPTAWSWSFPGSLTPTSNAQNPTNICYPNPGNFTVSLIATNSLGSDTEIRTGYIKVINCIPPVPGFVLPNDTFCLNECFEPINISFGAESYFWKSDGARFHFETDSVPIICFTDTGDVTITLIATNLWGSDSMELTVRVDTMPDISVDNDTVTINLGDDAVLGVNTPAGGWIAWLPDYNVDCDSCADVNAHPLVSTTYVVYYTDSNGCVATDTVFVEVIPKNIAIVPGAFSPNGDGQNDLLYVRGSDIDDMQFRIYDRFGNSMFSTTSQLVGWGGTYKGQPVNTGVYFWYLDVTFLDGERRTEKGQVVLVR